MVLPKFPWVYPYEEEQRTSGTFIEAALLRPVVPVQLIGPERVSQQFAALVDSGADHVLTPEWVGRAIGIAPDPHREMDLKIGGKPRKIRFAESTVRLCPPGTLMTSCTEGHEWDVSIGFFMDWADPPWLVVLGQRGFFDHFTVMMSRLAAQVAVYHRDEFDERHPPNIAQRQDSTPRFNP